MKFKTGRSLTQFLMVAYLRFYWDVLIYYCELAVINNGNYEQVFKWNR